MEFEKRAKAQHAAPFYLSGAVIREDVFKSFIFLIKELLVVFCTFSMPGYIKRSKSKVKKNAHLNDFSLYFFLSSMFN